MISEEKDFTTIEWHEVIVTLNSLLRSIDAIRVILDDDNLDENTQYDLEEELNDYVMFLKKLKIRYAEIDTKGKLSANMEKRLREFI